MNLENAAEAMDLTTDAKTLSWLKELFSQEMLWHMAGVCIKMVLVFVGIFLLQRVVNHLIDRLFKNRLAMGIAKKSEHVEEKRLNTLAKMFKSIAKYVLYFIGIITCLDMIGFSVTTIVAGAGIMSLAVAFGAQSIVQDLMSGIFIVLENQYAVGEIVKIGGVAGTVKEIGMKATKLQTVNGELMIIANGSVGSVINYSRAAQRATVDVGVAYEVDLDEAWIALQTACDRVARDERFAQYFDEKPNILGVIDLGASSVDIRLTFTAFHWMQLPIERELRKQVKLSLDAAGLEIPYSKVHLIQEMPKAPNDVQLVGAMQEQN